MVKVLISGSEKKIDENYVLRIEIILDLKLLACKTEKRNVTSEKL